MVLVFSLHGFNSSPNSNLETSIKDIILNILGNNGGYINGNLAGHSITQDSFNSQATITNIMNKAMLEIDNFNKQPTKSKVLIGTSTGAYPILQWLSLNPKNNISLVILFKPITNLEYSLEIIEKGAPGINKQIKSKDYLISFTRLVQQLKFGTKFKIKNKCIIISGSEDIVVGNSNFAKKYVKGKNIEFYEIKGAKHNELQKGELEEFRNIIFEEINKLKSPSNTSQLKQ